MPRGPRLDAFGTLHHMIVRGIEKRNIVDDYKDREDFLNRMGEIAIELQQRIKDEIENHCRNEKVPAETLRSGSRRPPLPKLRRAIALKLVNAYGVSLAETARQLGISTSAVAQILRREKGV